MTGFNYQGQPNTCLWDGRPLRRSYMTVWEYLTPRTCPRCKGTDNLDLINNYGGAIHRQCPAYYEGTSDYYFDAPKRVSSRTPHYAAPGYEGNGFFCTERCGYYFGRRLAQLGRRLKPISPPPPEEV